MADLRKTLDDLNEVTTLQLTDVLLTKRPGGATSKTEVRDILDLAKPADSIHAATAKTALADNDEFGLADSAAAWVLKKVTLANLIASIFKTARTITNAQFASATFKLFNASGTPRALSFVTTALTADRTLTMPDANVDLSNVAPADVKAWVNFNGTGTVAIRASKNVSSITDNGTGDYTVNFATALADANYGIVTGVQYAAGNNLNNLMIHSTTLPTASAARFLNYTQAGAAQDVAYVCVTFYR